MTFNGKAKSGIAPGPPPAPSPLPLQRDRFELPPDVAYLNCANLSPQLRAVTEAGVRAVGQKRAPWEISAPDWFSGADALRGLAARLLGSDADGIALVPGVSYGIAVAAANIPVRRGQEIVLLADQFPSNVYAWRERARAVSARVRTVTRPEGEAWTDAVVDAIGEDTAIVTVPNCHWTDGALVDLVRVAEYARAVGAALVVDASQSCGAFPLDLEAVRPDFLVSVGYKWLLGPYGLGYLYVGRQWRETGQPLESSWLTRAGAEDFTALTDYTDEYRRGARRFDMGEYPQFIHAPMALAALSQLCEWTIERVSETIGKLTDMIAREAEEIGCHVLPATARVRHMIGLRLPRGIPDTLRDRLAAERVYVSVRGDVIRVAPHVYNDETDVTRFLAVLRACV